MSKRALFISIFTYLIFFFPILNPDVVNYSGKDMTSIHYPARFYLDEKLHDGSFPFWTERMYLGFPIYLDLERAFLNIPNIVATFAFGPIAGFKIQHFLYYLLGSLGFYYFLKKYKVNDLGYFVANLTYFFSFFHLYHQQHYNMVMTTYSLPLLLYLIDKYVATKKSLFVLLFSLVITNLFYLGSFQSLFIVGLVSLLYFYIQSKDINKFLIFSGLLIFISTVPVLKPMIRLYSDSARSSEHIFTDGSFSPVMSTMTFIPLLFTYAEASHGVLVDRYYFMHETYVYVGFVALLLAVLGFFCTKDARLKKFVLLSVGMFLLLAFIKYVPILNAVGIPGFSLFRYWGRSVFLLSFVVSILAGIFVSRYKDFKVPSKKDLRWLLVPVFYIAFLELVNFGKTPSLTFIHVLLRDDFVIGFHNIAWISLVVVTLVILKLAYQDKFKNWFLRGWLVMLLTIDMVLFGNLALTNSFKHQSTIFRSDPFPTTWDNVRILDLNNANNGNRALYYKNWGLFGYSQFMPKSVSNLIHSLGFESTRHPDIPDDFFASYWDFIQLRLADLGFEYITNPLSSDDDKLLPGDIVMNGPDSVIVYPGQAEGHFTGRVVADVNSKVETNIRYDPGWKLWVDGEPGSIQKDTRDMFISFEVPYGEHKYELEYVPTEFYVGLGLAAFLYTIVVTAMFMSEKKAYAKK
jgi:hypothetical protein